MVDHYYYDSKEKKNRAQNVIREFISFMIRVINVTRVLVYRLKYL